MDDQPQSKVPNKSVVDGRQVREAIATVAASIEELQREAAFLIAIAGRPGHKPDQGSIRKALEATKNSLESAVSNLPDRLRDHGRITDQRKAITSLEAQLARL
jgi:hypothetical protein